MHRFLGWSLFSLECLWGIGWIVSMAFGHALTSAPALEYRQAIFFLVFHILFNFVPLSHLVFRAHPKDRTNYPFQIIFLFVLGITVDLNSLLETVLHLPQSNSLWYAMITLSSVALFLSITSLLWFICMDTSLREIEDKKRQKLLPRDQ
jgi:hypothetical protein